MDTDSCEGSAVPGVRVAIVTGSSRGIGLAVAEVLAAGGAAVVVNGRDPTVAEHAAEGIRRAGGRATAVAGSAADPRIAQTLLRAAEEFGPVDALVTCTGTAEPVGSSILSVTPDEWNELIASHLTATFTACRAVAPQMVARGKGTIVTTSSHAFLGIYGGTGYPAGKGAVTSLTMAIAAELAEYGVRVNAVCPGARTRLSTGAVYEAHLAELHQRGMLDDLTLAGSLDPGPPGHVAALYAFLASDLSAGITGRVFAGAGGYLGRFPVPEPELLAWRDHATNPPWSLAEIDRHVRAR